MLKLLVVAFSLTVAAGAAANGQDVRTPVAPLASVPGQADMMKLQAAMMAAQAAAIKPGDEALPCAALQKELVSTMNDPAIQAYAAKTNAVYAKELAAREKQGAMTAEYAAAMAAALAPGMAMGGMLPIAPGQPLTPQQMQQAMLAQQQAAIAYMNQLLPIMPALMRSQRVTQLAVMKNCVWATGGLGLYPGAVPYGAIPPIPPGLSQR